MAYYIYMLFTDTCGIFFTHLDSLEVAARKAVSATSFQRWRSSWSKPAPCCWSRYIRMPWDPADVAEDAEEVEAVYIVGPGAILATFVWWNP